MWMVVPCGGVYVSAALAACVAEHEVRALRPASGASNAVQAPH